MKINLNLEDLEKASNTIPVGWQTLEIKEVVEKTAKSGDGLNTVVTFEEISGKFQTRDVYFSSKALYFNGPDMFLPFLAACNGAPLQTLLDKLKSEKNVEIDTQALKGKRVMAKVEPDTYNGRETVKFAAWAPAGTATQTAAGK